MTKTADEFRVEIETLAGILRQFWDKHNIVLEKDGTGAVEAEYTLDPQPYGNLLSQRRDGESSFYHYDALGSTAALTDDTQTETDSYFYKAFGALLASTGTTDNPFTWVGQLGYYRDQTTGLYSLRAREYGPAVGRFLSEDPLRFIIGDEN